MGFLEKYRIDRVLRGIAWTLLLVVLFLLAGLYMNKLDALRIQSLSLIGDTDLGNFAKSVSLSCHVEQKPFWIYSYFASPDLKGAKVIITNDGTQIAVISDRHGTPQGVFKYMDGRWNVVDNEVWGIVKGKYAKATEECLTLFRLL